MITSKLLLSSNPWHHAEIIGLLPTEQERNFQLVDVFGPMVDIVKSPTKADEKALWTVRWKDHIVDPFKAREKGITLISVRDGNKTASSEEEYALLFASETDVSGHVFDSLHLVSTGMTGTISQVDNWIEEMYNSLELLMSGGEEEYPGEMYEDFLSYIRYDYVLTCFPVEGGRVYTVVTEVRSPLPRKLPRKSHVWRPTGGNISAKQGVRLQVKNMKPNRECSLDLTGKTAASKCPSCGSTDYSLMPTDFETAKCNDCGKNWDHGIVKGINEPPPKLGSMSKKASYYIPEGYNTPTALAPEMKWLWTPDNGPHIFPEYRVNNRGLLLMCLHEKFCSENGLPSHGYSFDRIDRGYVTADKNKKWIRISVSGASENIDEALDDMVEDIQYSFPDTKEWKFTTTGPDNRVLRPGLEENDVPRGERLDHPIDWGLYASTRSKELHWVTADKVQPGDILAMSGTFMAVKKATSEGGGVALIGEPGQVHHFGTQDKVNVYKGAVKRPSIDYGSLSQATNEQVDKMSDSEFTEWKKAMDLKIEALKQYDALLEKFDSRSLEEDNFELEVKIVSLHSEWGFQLPTDLK